MLIFGHLWPLTCQTMLYKVHCKVLRRLAQTTTKLIVLQDLCYLGFLCGPKKKSLSRMHYACPLGLCIWRVPGSVLFLVFCCLLKHGCLASIYSLNFCYAFLLCLFLLYTIVHLINVWFFWGSIWWYSQSGNHPPSI